ncbi:methionyl-tRNA formyltransferase [Candidatus Falkowbacteria bacterium]|nr:methionyl-tRNA formyltransferase [Candidatus Falkowbacteria bacterium]
MKPPIRTIFIGTPAFSVPALEALLSDHDFNVVAVISQPDRPIGRKQEVTPTPVKQSALLAGVPVLQPEKIREIIPQISELKPEIIIVVAYAQIIPEELLRLPKFGCINIHASLLPKYRGASVLQAPILNGDKESGVTIMKMDKTLDTGPIINQAKINLEPDETPSTLAKKLSDLGASILTTTLKKFISGEFKAVPQNNSFSSYVKMLTKDDGRIDWNDSAENIERKVRAMMPWPGAWTTWDGQTLKITAVNKEIRRIEQYRPGEAFSDHGKLAIQCGIDALVVERLQLEGKSVMGSEEFLRGNAKILHQILT